MKKIIIFTLLLILRLYSATNVDLMFEAVKNGSLEQVKGLVLKDATLVNIKNALQQTPLIVAVLNKHQDVTFFLLKHGADIECKCHYSPLELALIQKDSVIIKLLIEHGANVRDVSENICSPLRWAIENNDVVLAKLLIDKGVSLHKKGMESSPLYLAIQNEQIEIIQYLVQKDERLLDEKMMGSLPLFEYVVDKPAILKALEHTSHYKKWKSLQDRIAQSQREFKAAQESLAKQQEEFKRKHPDVVDWSTFEAPQSRDFSTSRDLPRFEDFSESLRSSCAAKQKKEVSADHMTYTILFVGAITGITCSLLYLYQKLQKKKEIKQKETAVFVEPSEPIIKVSKQVVL